MLQGVAARNGPRDGQCYRTPGAFLLPSLLWDTGPDGEDITPHTSCSHSPAPEPATAGKKKSNTRSQCKHGCTQHHI